MQATFAEGQLKACAKSWAGRQGRQGAAPAAEALVQSEADPGEAVPPSARPPTALAGPQPACLGLEPSDRDPSSEAETMEWTALSL